MLYLDTEISSYSKLHAEGLPIHLVSSLRGLRIWVLNLMPLKQETEEDLCRMLAHEYIDVGVTWIRIPNQRYKTTPQQYVEQHYKALSTELMATPPDGLIITGAPLEHLEFEAVYYWRELCELMEWSKTKVKQTLNICWAAQAALYYHEGVKKSLLPAKIFGVFAQDVKLMEHPLMKGYINKIQMPQSRHTTVNEDDFTIGLEVLSTNEECGVGVVVSTSKRQTFVTGHLEYNAQTLHQEYLRDLAKGCSIVPAVHYYEENDPNGRICFSWYEDARRFYLNWLRWIDYCA